MTLQEKLSIIQNQFGLQIKEIEPTVYKVINTNKEVNRDKLQWALKECVLLTSSRKGKEREPNGSCTTLSNIYYIVIDHNTSLAQRYENLKEYDDIMLVEYKHNPNTMYTIDTLYRVGVE